MEIQINEQLKLSIIERPFPVSIEFGNNNFLLLSFNEMDAIVEAYQEYKSWKLHKENHWKEAVEDFKTKFPDEQV